MTLEDLIRENTSALQNLNNALANFVQQLANISPGAFPTTKGPPAAKRVNLIQESKDAGIIEEAPSPIISYSELADAFRKAMQTKGRPWAVELLKFNGLKDLKSAQPSQYEAIMTSIVGVL